MSSEYEYSFNVSNLEDVICYCKDNGFIMTKNCYQVREIFRNKQNGYIARITTDIVNEKVSTVLDFKEDKMTGEVLIQRKESGELVFEDRQSVLSILEFLGCVKDNEVKRNRIVYEKQGVKLELDDYFGGNYVVAIEGDKQKADSVFEILKVFKV